MMKDEDDAEDEDVENHGDDEESSDEQLPDTDRGLRPDDSIGKARINKRRRVVEDSSEDGNGKLASASHVSVRPRGYSASLSGRRIDIPSLAFCSLFPS